MEMHYEEIHDLGNKIQKEDNGITSHSHEQDKNKYVAKACRKHDEKSRSMNTPETGYCETEVAKLILSDDKESKQRFIIGVKTIQQDSDTDVATHHRKIEDVTRYPELTASNNKRTNEIKDRVKKQSLQLKQLYHLVM